MENQQQQNEIFGLQFDEQAKNNIWTMARWAIISVLASIAGYLLEIVAFIKQQFQPSPFTDPDFELSGLLKAGVTGGGIIGLLFSIMLGLLLCYFLYRFSLKAKQGIEKNEMVSMNESFANFKNYFLVTGILTIVVMVFVVLILFIAFAVGLGSLAG